MNQFVSESPKLQLVLGHQAEPLSPHHKTVSRGKDTRSHTCHSLEQDLIARLEPTPDVSIVFGRTHMDHRKQDKLNLISWMPERVHRCPDTEAVTFDELHRSPEISLYDFRSHPSP